ncbi:MAG: hypothetical protein ACRDHZ_22670, partial [Ktedonobacteraceae bacterium]
YWYANNNPYRYVDPDGSYPGAKSDPCPDVACKQQREQQQGNEWARNVYHASIAIAPSPSSRSTTLASNSGTGSSVTSGEARNGLDAAAKEYEKLVKLGVIRPSAAALFAEVLARGANAAITSYQVGMMFGSFARITFEDAHDDIQYYIDLGRAPGVTGFGYEGSLIQWGKYFSWQLFDPGLHNSQAQIWMNFLIVSGMYSKSQAQ